MPWTYSTDVTEYEAAAGALLRSDAARHTIGATVLDQALRRGEPLDPPELYAWWRDEQGGQNGVTGCASITPPWPVLLESVPEEALRPLVDGLRAGDHDVTGVNGPNEVAATFATLWQAASGDRVLLHTASRLFALKTLREPQHPAAGFPRLATEADIVLCIDWYVRFGEETHGIMPRVEENVRSRLELDGLWLWCDSGGEPVSLVGHSNPVDRVARVGPVYTPADRRGNGYAESLTHAVSKALVADGRRLVLFTDQANPTSNGIYTRLGYRPVMDRLMLTFEPSHAEPAH